MAVPKNENCFKIRQATSDDVEEIWKIVKQEGWASCSFQVTRAVIEIAEDGWFVAEQDGEILGFVMGYNINETTSFPGFLIVKPEHRGKYIGKALLNEVGSYMGDRRISFVAILQVEPMYVKLGNTRSPRGGVNLYSLQLRNMPIPQEAKVDYELKDYIEVDWKDLLDYDTSFHIIPRERVLNVWFEIPESKTKVIQQNGKIVGYGTIKPVPSGHVIGPLYADTTAACMILLNYFATAIPANSKVLFTMPTASEDGKRLLEYNKDTLIVVWKGVFMEKKQAPSFSKLHKVVAIFDSAICFL
ncbi:uncharacterized protein LOC106166550 [Lingula anatina]|uniref:Uncharacterized protein LOC106166550 n=1 Tax=Lingula anatina TaxID=7574 RepID=A0A1S3IRQ1_LINAN|nr:uncharacterized protein LOC106166550 [Lingula anatina]|eukprot:XP_013400606.1 uncharacterized protein LOC106166550 [Lingula anatina]